MSYIDAKNDLILEFNIQTPIIVKILHGMHQLALQA